MALTNYEELAAVALLGIGLTVLVLDRNLIKKILGFSMADAGIYLLLTARGYIAGRLAPIAQEGITDAAAYINPIPTGLVLTGIVVSVASTAAMLALTVRLYARYHTLNLDEITQRARKEGD